MSRHAHNHHSSRLCICCTSARCLCKASQKRCDCCACSSGDSSSLSSGLAALAQPFKLRLARSEHEQQLKDYSSNVVLIEPLASMTAVEDFLWSKVYRSDASPSPPARTASAAAAGTVSSPLPCLTSMLFTPTAGGARLDWQHGSKQ